MDILDGYEQKFFPNFHATRLKMRTQKAFELRDKAMNSPEELDMSELKIILGVLKNKKLLPPDHNHLKIQ